MPDPEEDDESFGETGFEEGDQVGGAEFGGGPGQVLNIPASSHTVSSPRWERGRRAD